MEHKREDLEGDIELSVVLPNTSIVSFTVKRRLPLMDLLVLVSSKHHLKPSEHMIQAISENNTIIRSTPNTPVGALKARYIQIVQKHVMEEPQPAPPVAPPRRNALPNISSTLPPKHKPDVKSLDPQKLLLSFRLLVHLPNNQLHVMRVTPDMTISDILLTVQDAKNLNINNFSIRNKHNPETELDFNNTLAHYQIKELVLERKNPPVYLTQSRISLQQTEPSTSTFKSGLKSFFTNLKLSSGKNRHKLSLREGQIKQPAVQKKVQNVFYKEPILTPQETSQTVITPMNRPKPPPRKRHAPPPPPVRLIKDTEVISSQTTNKSEVGNGVIVQDTLQELSTSKDFEGHVQCDIDIKESQKKQLVRQLAVVSAGSSTESAKEENPKILLNETTLYENFGNHADESDINNHLRSVSQSTQHVMLNPKESNNINNEECISHIVENTSKKENHSDNFVNQDFCDRYPQCVLQKDPNTEVINAAPSFTHDTIKPEIPEQRTENQDLHDLEMESRIREHCKDNLERICQTNTFIENSEQDEYIKLQVDTEIPTDLQSNVKEITQFSTCLVNEIEIEKAELQNKNIPNFAIYNSTKKNYLENEDLKNKKESVIDDHVKKEQSSDENSQNAYMVMKNFIKEESQDENLKTIEKTGTVNIINKNKLTENEETGQQQIETNLVDTGKSQNLIQNNSRKEIIKPATNICVESDSNDTENMQTQLQFKKSYETLQSPTSLTNASINVEEGQSAVCNTNNINLPISNPRSVINNKDNFIDNKKPLSKASSELNVSTISRHTPRFLLTSWSSDKVPKVVRIADDTTHGSSAYSQITTSSPSTVLDKQQIPEKTFSQGTLQSKTEQCFTRPVVVSVICKDPNCNPSKINDQNGNMEKGHPDISIESSKEKTITSRSTSSYTAKAINTPPKIQSWELVNAIEKMLKKNSNNGMDNSSKTFENVQSGNEGNKYFNKTPFELLPYISQIGKPSYFQIIAQNEYIRSKIPLELSEQSKRSSNESLPLVNDYGSGKWDGFPCGCANRHAQ